MHDAKQNSKCCTTSRYFVSHPSSLSWHWYAISLAMASSWRCWTCQHQPLSSQRTFWIHKKLIQFSGIILYFFPGRTQFRINRFISKLFWGGSTLLLCQLAFNCFELFRLEFLLVFRTQSAVVALEAWKTTEEHFHKDDLGSIGSFSSYFDIPVLWSNSLALAKELNNTWKA